MTNKKLHRKLFTLHSGNFTTSNVPLDFLNWNEKDQFQWLRNHKWEPFEDWNVKDIFNLIDCAVEAHEEWLKTQ